ncbi:type III-B CRISPR module-associated Cmr3 family protein [Desulfosporosinus shakirovi]|uniref:type III-B CRISPR module-associated Cmr3 family protein n=1 Tax=Desulfosporosinus shakirovi TaxID=2885154 RepID=UPI001E4BB767|nr:type III-B CRISPR module-associated Cmr3 family protein [Desulfosporosinus sp. SRJS8]MCB8818363.1 hypothetical protein [Desulfosporosinus sp. SRJS8]
MFYKIDAVDTLFFRSAAPFDAGVNYAPRSLFPPLPSVYTGALYSCALPQNDAKISAKALSLSRQLKIGFNGVMINNDFCFPRPLDTIVVEGTGLDFMYLSPSPIGSYPLQYCLSDVNSRYQKQLEPRGGGYLIKEDLQTYLAGESKGMACYSLADHYHEEDRIGIQIDRNSGAAQDKKMYHIKMARPADRENNKCSLVVEANGISLPEQAVVKIGGEGKVAQLCRLDRSISLSPVAEKAEFFKLYFATPAIFKKGWLPWWIDEKTKTGVFAYKKRQIRVKLICAAVGRYIPTGGFSVDPHDNKAKPREMRYAIPAGSVYYFQIIEGTFEDASKLFHQKCLSDYRETRGFIYDNWDRMRYCDRGFGYCFVGAVKNEEGQILCMK